MLVLKGSEKFNKEQLEALIAKSRLLFMQGFLQMVKLKSIQLIHKLSYVSI